MSTPINLNRVRKARAKAEKRKQADENAVRYGRNKAEKERLKSEEKRKRDLIDGHALDTPKDKE